MPRANAPVSTSLSELEGGVLGIVATKPGCTAHAIREGFLRSRSSHWSGSAGAIYPLMKKLVSRELLKVEESPRGSRVRRTYTITAAGTKELRRWLGPPLAAWTAAVTYDPLRTRMYFLAALSPAKREAFLSDAVRLLESEAKELRRELREMRGPDAFWDRAAQEGTIAITEARIRWVRKTARALRSR